MFVTPVEAVKIRFQQLHFLPNISQEMDGRLELTNVFFAEVEIVSGLWKYRTSHVIKKMLSAYHPSVRVYQFKHVKPPFGSPKSEEFWGYQFSGSLRPAFVTKQLRMPEDGNGTGVFRRQPRKKALNNFIEHKDHQKIIIIYED